VTIDTKEQISIIKQGCPMCNGVIKGSVKYKYYCIHCDIWIEEHHFYSKN